MTFIHEIRLKTTAADRKELDKLLDLCRIQYNSYLRDVFDMREQMIQHPDYIRAIEMREAGASKSECNVFFRSAQKESKFSKFGAINFVAKNRKSFFAEHIPSKICAAFAARAFTAVSEFHYGGRGKPFFRPKWRQFSTIPCANDSAIRFRFDKKTGKYKVLLNDLNMDIFLDDDQDIYQKEIISRIEKDPKIISYTQLSKKIINGKSHWYAQITINEGVPPEKHSHYHSGKKVAFDIGTTTIAIVHEDGVILKYLVEDVDFIELDRIDEKVAELMRQLDVKRRAFNAGLYNEDGTVKKGSKGKFKSSKNMKELEDKIKELRRKQAAHRKNLHGRLANEILSLGSVVHCEKIDYRQWQKNYGKLIGNRAPAMLVGMIKNKVLAIGGEFVEIDTRTTKFSQVCHNCDHVEKKPLFVRVHDCNCGVFAHRDLYSALLAYAYDPKTKKLDKEEAALMYQMYQKLQKEMAEVMVKYNANRLSLFIQESSGESDE